MKKIVSILLTGCLALSFSACSNQKQNASISSSKGSIIIWSNLENEIEVLQKYAQKWEDKTGNKASVIHETPDLQQFSQAVKTNEGPDGVYGIANDQLANYINADLAQALPDDLYNDKDYIPAAVQAVYSGGLRYAVPIAVETISLFYNAKMVSEPPKTWDEMISNASEKGLRFDGTSIYYDIGFLRAYDSYIFKYKDGAYDVSDIGLGNSGAISAYEYLKTLSEKGFTGSDITSDIARGSFQNGETAFYIGGPWDIAGFKSAGVPFAIAKMPSLNGKEFVTTVGTQIGFVSSKSKNKELVYDFYRYLQENAQEDLYSAGGRIPAKLSAQGIVQKDEYSKAFLEQIKNGESLPTVSELGQVWTPYSDNMKLLFSGKISPKEAAEYISKQVKEGINLMNSGN